MTFDPYVNHLISSLIITLCHEDHWQWNDCVTSSFLMQKCNGKFTSFETVIHRVMCVDLKLILRWWGLSVVGVLTLSCPAVSQIRNLCSSFPHGTVLVRNDALRMKESVSQQCFWACSSKGTGNKSVQVSKKQITLRIKMLDYEPMLPSTNAVLGQRRRKQPNKKELTQFV